MTLDTVIAAKIDEASTRIGKNLTQLDKVARVREELAEVEAELAAGNTDKAGKELGDLLLAVVLLANTFNGENYGLWGPEDFYNASARKVDARLEVIAARMARGISRADAIKEAKALYP